MGENKSQWLPAPNSLLIQSSAGLQIFARANSWNAAVQTIPGATLPVIFSPSGAESSTAGPSNTASDGTAFRFAPGGWAASR